MAKSNGFAWLLQVEEQYGTRFIRAHVVIPQENGELFNAPSHSGFSQAPGIEFDGFRVTAYLGNVALTSSMVSAGGEIWGLGHEFAPFRVGNLDHAKSMVSVFGKIARGMAKAEAESGYVRDGDFHSYFLRIAASLNIRTYYVRNGKRQRENSGETFRKVNPATLQWWIGDISETAANRPSELEVSAR